MNSLRVMVVAAAAALALCVVCCGCHKSADDAAATPGAVPGASAAPASTVTPEVQGQIDASQKADAARHAQHGPPPAK